MVSKVDAGIVFLLCPCLSTVEQSQFALCLFAVTMLERCGTCESVGMQNVVWEKLDDLMGNTQFLKADFTPYGSTSLSEQVSDAADLVQAAFAGVAPTRAHASPGATPL